VSLQVALEGEGFVAGAEGDDGLDAPGAVFGSCSDSAGVVAGEACPEIRRDAHVGAIGTGLALQQIDVVERRHGEKIVARRTLTRRAGCTVL